MKLTKTLEDRIISVRTECEKFINDKAAELKESAEGVPIDVLKGLLMARSGACVCRAVLNVMESGQ